MVIAEFFTTIGIANKCIDIARSLKGSQTLQEHLNLLRTKLEFLGQEKAQTEEQVRALEQKVAEMKTDLETYRQFRDWNGAKFRILPIGGLDAAVYCGACSKPAFIKGKTFACQCGWHSIFPASKAFLLKTLVEVSKAYGEPIEETALADRIHQEPEKAEGGRRVNRISRLPNPNGW
jgi:hypothetical protein